MRQWTLEELNKLYAQEERPTDPETLRAWKIVRHAKHYGMGQERLQQFLHDKLREDK